MKQSYFIMVFYADKNNQMKSQFITASELLQDWMQQDLIYQAFYEPLYQGHELQVHQASDEYHTLIESCYTYLSEFPRELNTQPLSS